MEVIKYLIGGEEVHLQEKLEGGYLVRRVLYADREEKDRFDLSDIMCLKI